MEKSNICENCGNDYEKAFYVSMNGKEHCFDSFECAINRLAPQCAHCGTTVIGHGLEKDEQIYCCSHCVKAATKGHHTQHVEAHN